MAFTSAEFSFGGDEFATECLGEDGLGGCRAQWRLMAAILASLHMQTADDLFGGPQGSPRRPTS